MKQLDAALRMHTEWRPYALLPGKFVCMEQYQEPTVNVWLGLLAFLH
jgi:hypothetical protein